MSEGFFLSLKNARIKKIDLMACRLFILKSKQTILNTFFLAHSLMLISTPKSSTNTNHQLYMSDLHALFCTIINFF